MDGSEWSIPAPVVCFLNPCDGEVFEKGAPVNVYATAVGREIRGMCLYLNNILIAKSFKKSISFMFSDLAPGKHVIKVTAFNGEIAKKHIKICVKDYYPKTSTEDVGIYGSFHYRDNPDGSITIDADWVRENIVKIRLPGVNKMVCVHKLAAAKFLKAFQLISTQKVIIKEDNQTRRVPLLSLVKQVGPPFLPRHKGRDVNRSLSNHSWGIAIDLNEDQYPMGTLVNPELTPFDPSYLLWIHAFKPAGFVRWGNDYGDPMHYELVSTN